MLRIVLPFKTPSLANARLYWRKRAEIAKAQRNKAKWMVQNEVRYPFPLPVRVTLTRAAPRALDDDNLAGALKHVRDGVADGLGLPNDRDNVTWQYGQARQREPEVWVDIESDTKGAAQ